MRFVTQPFQSGRLEWTHLHEKTPRLARWCAATRRGAREAYGSGTFADEDGNGCAMFVDASPGFASAFFFFRHAACRCLPYRLVTSRAMAG